MNGPTVQELKEEEHGKMNRCGPLNKERVTKEYNKRVRKIWSSELYGNNKVTAHNTLAVPVITPIIGILE